MERLTPREWRRRKALTQDELATAAGVTQFTISQLEQGKAEPRISTIRKVAAALGIQPDQLIIERHGGTKRDEEQSRRAA